MTDPGHVGTTDVAPPPFTSFPIACRGGAYWGGTAPTWRRRTKQCKDAGSVACSARERPRTPQCAGSGGARRLLLRRFLNVEAVGFGHIGDAFAELGGRGLQRAGELDDRRQAGL